MRLLLACRGLPCRGVFLDPGPGKGTDRRPETVLVVLLVVVVVEDEVVVELVVVEVVGVVVVVVTQVPLAVGFLRRKRVAPAA